jgi:hypothetical protein
VNVSFARYDIFVSYSHQDCAYTDPFVEALRRHGYRVFYDTKSIVVGEPWKQRLAQAIGKSRTCVLCWSSSARNSEYVSFEYSSAEALRKPVLPWLLDSTPLPQMIEIQGIVERDPARAALLLLPRLGWRLSLRRLLQGFCLLLLLATAAVGCWRLYLAPPPWEFSGRVVDSETRLPISGVKIEAEGNRFVAYTDMQGRYILYLPQPKPKHLQLVFAKEGYRGEEPVSVSSDRPFNTDMTRLR